MKSVPPSQVIRGSLLASMKVEEKTGLDNEVVVSFEKVLISHSNLSCVSDNLSMCETFI